MRNPTLPVLLLAVSSWSAWIPSSRPLPGTIQQVMRLPKGLMALCYGKPHLSTDQGASWKEANGGLPAGVSIGVGASMGDTVVAFGGGTIWRTCDAGTSWAKWDEGFVVYPGYVNSMDMVRGDSSIVLSVYGEYGLIVWKRNPHSKWVWTYSPGSSEEESKALWFGRKFVTRSGNMVIELDPSDSEWNVSSATPVVSTSAWFKGEWWAAGGNRVLKTSDSGRSWDTLYRSTPWISHLSPTSFAVIGIGSDSMAMMNPASSAPLRFLKQPEPYGVDLVEFGTRWAFLGENATWYSDDSGKQWTRGGIPGMGLVGKIVPTSQGLVMQDYGLYEQAWISSGQGAWTSLALPAKVRFGGIDTAAGLLHALGHSNIWTRSGDAWVMDSVVGKGFMEISGHLAWDGSRLWTADGKRLYSTALQPRAWTLTDSSAMFGGISFIRFWKDRLWLGGQASLTRTGLTMFLGSRTKDGLWTNLDIRGTRVTAMAPTAKALWIGTDSCLYRFDSDKVPDPVAIGPWKPGGMVVALAARGDTVAVSMTGNETVINTDKLEVYLSFDNGDSWHRDDGRMAMDFHIGADRIVAASTEGGLVEWSGGTGTSRGAHGAQRDFSWRPGRLEWSVTDAVSLDILDVQGCILSHLDFAPGTSGIELPPASSLRIARLTGPSGSRTIAVPPLR